MVSNDSSKSRSMTFGWVASTPNGRTKPSNSCRTLPRQREFPTSRSNRNAFSLSICSPPPAIQQIWEQPTVNYICKQQLGTHKTRKQPQELQQPLRKYNTKLRKLQSKSTSSTKQKNQTMLFLEGRSTPTGPTEHGSWKNCRRIPTNQRTLPAPSINATIMPSSTINSQHIHNK